MEDRVELQVMGVTYNPVQSGAYALLLRQVDGPYRIPIVVGIAEAQSIAMRLENIIPPRPMSHDLMVSMFHAYGISLEKVVIYKFSEGVFMSELYLHNGDNEIVLDSRTSDAIALALRTNAPIFTTPEIMAKTGILMQEDEKSPVMHKKRQEKRKLEDFSIPELEKRMQRYVDEEEYELAAEVQKIIKKKQENKETEKQENKETPDAASDQNTNKQ